VNVIDDDGFACGSGGSADTLVEGDAGVRRHGAAIGSEDENGFDAGKLLQHVKAYPVVAQDVVMKELHDGFEKIVGGTGRGGKRIELLGELREGRDGHGIRLRSQGE